MSTSKAKFKKFKKTKTKTQMSNLQKIQTNLDVATPMFQFYLKNISWDIAQWLYLEKTIIEQHEIWFHFTCSSIPLQFRVYGGVNVHNLKSFSAYYLDAYLYFTRIKLNTPQLKKDRINELHTIHTAKF
jgi:hypothetical protein